MMQFSATLCILLFLPLFGYSQQKFNHQAKGGTIGSTIIVGNDSTTVSESGTASIAVKKGLNLMENKKQGYLSSVFIRNVSSVGSTNFTLSELIPITDFTEFPNRILLNSIVGHDKWQLKRYDSYDTYLSNNPQLEKEEEFSDTDESLLTDALGHFMDIHDMSPSSENGFSVNKQILNLTVTLTEIEKIIVETEDFIQINSKMKIVLSDLKLNPLIERTLTINGNYSTDDSFLKEILNNLQKGVCTFFNELEVQSHLKGSHNSDELTNTAHLSLTPAKAAENYIEARKSVVTILTESGHGSGCQISKDGYLLTNYHVVKGFDSVQVILFSGDTIKAMVKQINPLSDLALLKVEQEFLNAFKISTETSLAQDVFAIGSPLSPKLSQSISAGILSARVEINSISYFQFDARINEGNSGGALVNSKGELIGIVNAKSVSISIEGISFAIPIVESIKAFNLDFSN